MRALVKLHVIAVVLLWLCWWEAFVYSLGVRAGSHSALGRDYMALSCPRTGSHAAFFYALRPEGWRNTDIGMYIFI